MKIFGLLICLLLATNCVRSQTPYDTSMYYEVFPIVNPTMLENPVYVREFPLGHIIDSLNEKCDTVFICTLNHTREKKETFVVFKKKEWFGFRIIDKPVDNGYNLWDSTIHHWTMCKTSTITSSDTLSMDSLFNQMLVEIKKPLLYSKLIGSIHHCTYVYLRCGNVELYQEILGRMNGLYAKLRPLYRMVIFLNETMSRKESYVLKRKTAFSLF